MAETLPGGSAAVNTCYYCGEDTPDPHSICAWCRGQAAREAREGEPDRQIRLLARERFGDAVDPSNPEDLGWAWAQIQDEEESHERARRIVARKETA